MGSILRSQLVNRYKTAWDYKVHTPPSNVWLASEGCRTNDLQSYKNRLGKVVKEKELGLYVLGWAETEPLLLVTSPTNSGPHLLFAGSFHGEEPAGSWGILRFLEGLDADVFKQVNLSFLPVVNPVGFSAGIRSNGLGEAVNGGFIHPLPEQPEPSREGKILVQNLNLLRGLASDGFVSLHEDVDGEGFYTYTFEGRKTAFSVLLRDSGADYFPVVDDGNIRGAKVKNGVIRNHHDGSFEDLLHHVGVPRTACTETPASWGADIRASANAQIRADTIRYTLAITHVDD